MRQHFTYENLYKRLRTDLCLIERDGLVETFGVTRDQYLWLMDRIKKLMEFDKASIAMPGAILLSLVATFDSAVSDLLYTLLRLRPEKYHSSSKTIMLKDLLLMSSFEEALDKIVEDEIDMIMRDSHDKQVKALEECIGIKIRDNYDEYNEFIEIFERRNLVAHGDCVANTLYLRNCKEVGINTKGINKGDRLFLTPKYLARSADRLMEFALLANFSAWKKNFPDDIEDIYSTVLTVTYQLIKDQRYRTAARILEFVLFKQNVKITDQLRKRMTINLANSQKKLRNNKRSIEIVESIDLSATSDIFKLCIASIRDDISQAVQLLRKVAQQEEEIKSYLREWPVFDWIRDNDLVRAEFEAIFGEPLRPAVESKGIEVNEDKYTSEGIKYH